MSPLKKEPLPPDDLKACILQARGGSREAFMALSTQYTPLILSMVSALSPHELSAQELEDLRDEAERKLLDAVYTYDLSQQEVTFGLYAKVCIHNALVSELRRIETARRVTVIPLDDPALTGLTDGEDPARTAADQERYEQLCRRIRTRLSPLENSIWWAFMAGQSVGEIAASLGRSEKSVHNAIYRIRSKLRRLLEATE